VPIAGEGDDGDEHDDAEHTRPPPERVLSFERARMTGPEPWDHLRRRLSTCDTLNIDAPLSVVCEVV
jgi:hypothetical protein